MHCILPNEMECVKNCCANGQQRYRRIVFRWVVLFGEMARVSGVVIADVNNDNGNKSGCLPAQWQQANPANPTGHVPLLPPALVR